MPRLATVKTLALALAVLAAADAVRAASPAWESGGQAFEVSDLPSVIVASKGRGIDGQPPLPPEPVVPEPLGPAMPVEVTEGPVLGESEDAAVPTLSDRLEGFMPQVGMARVLTPYDSAASLEADGSVVTGGDAARGWGLLPCGPDACWSARVEAIALWRNSPTTRPLYNYLVTDNAGAPAIGPVALDANQLVSDPLAAGRVSLMRADSCGHGFEAAYLYAGNFYAARELPFLPQGYALSPPGIYGNPFGPAGTPISAAQTKLTSNLQSAEFNLREPIGWGSTRFLVGFRWLQWFENWQLDDQFSDPADPTVFGQDAFGTRCVNNLYGGQIGLDSVLWNTGKGLRIDGVVKAGAYYNNAFQYSSFYYQTSANIPNPVISSAAGTSTQVASFVGEVGLTAVVPLHRNLDLRCGYFGMWLQGIAQPINQLSGQTLNQFNPPAATITAAGSPILQGVTLGLEGRW